MTNAILLANNHQEHVGGMAYVLAYYPNLPGVQAAVNDR
jgi:hypothetical protein